MSLLRVLLVPTLLCAVAIAHAATLAPGTEVVVAVREGSQARLRAGPGTDRPVVGRAPRGTRLRVAERAPRGRHVWYRVVAPDGTLGGWIRGDLVEPAPEGEGAAERPEPPESSEPASPPAPPLPGWAARIAPALHGIDACIAATTKRPAAILKVRPLPFDMISVVVEDGSGLLWECVVEPRGAAPLRYDPLPEAALGERTLRGPRFFRGDVPPAGDCRRLRPLTDPERGTVLGTFVYPDCADGATASQSTASRTSASNSSESGRSSSSSTRK